MQLDVVEPLRDALSEDVAFTLAITILVAGVFAAYAVWRWTGEAFRRTGLDEVVEGTTFERTAQRFNTSTKGVVAFLFAASVYGLAVLLAFNLVEVLEVDVFWPRVAELLPQVMIAIFAIIIGLILGDKAHLYVQERLRSVKLPEASVLPDLVKYSIFYIAALIALAQIGVATTALIVLLAAYAFGIVLLGAVALKDLLAAGAAGLYLLFTEPYVIGDEVRIDERRGIVQEVDIFVTRVEANGEEYIIPNQRVFQSGIVRIRDSE